MPERLNGPVLKTGVGFGSPWVRIPPSPLYCVYTWLVGCEPCGWIQSLGKSHNQSRHNQNHHNQNHHNQNYHNQNHHNQNHHNQSRPVLWASNSPRSTILNIKAGAPNRAVRSSKPKRMNSNNVPARAHDESTFKSALGGNVLNCSYYGSNVITTGRWSFVCHVYTS